MQSLHSHTQCQDVQSYAPTKAWQEVCLFERQAQNHSLNKLSNILIVLVSLACFASQPALAQTELPNPLSLVNPFIGTGGHGHTHPAAMRPFGMIQAGPDTRLSGWDGCSGYHFDDDTIYGFSQTHLSGTGVSDYGDVLLMPFLTTGEGQSWADAAFSRPYPFAAGFRHADEQAQPGYYAVTLANGIRVEIVASDRAAMYRLIYPAGAIAGTESEAGAVAGTEAESEAGEGAGGSGSTDPGSSSGGNSVAGSSSTNPGNSTKPAPPAPVQSEHPPALWLDLDHRDKVVAAEMRQSGAHSLSGYRVSDAWAKKQHVYFHMETSREMLGWQQQGNRALVTFAPAARRPAAKSRNSPSPDTIYIRISISAVDEAGARTNLAAEIPGFDWSAQTAATTAVWREALNRVTVSGGTPAQQQAFYTAVYHALSAPNLYVDADGRYRGMDHAVHQADGFTPYTVFSLWDTYRAAHPLYTLLWPAQNRDFIRTMLDDYQKGGRLPVWKLADYETDCMIGYHSAPVIVDAWAKGQRDFDAQLALEALVLSAERAALGLPEYRRYGYIPADADAESVSKTLEYAYDDACIARLAAGLAAEHQSGMRPEKALPDGRAYTAIADTFARRATAWKHLLDPATGFFRARQNGGFVTPFDPAEVNFHYTEANAWQYSFAAPHDLRGHGTMLAGTDQHLPTAREALAAHLDALFSANPATTGREQADITGLIGQYAHGNEPSHHMAYGYAHLGQPWKTQKLVRQILTELYSNAPDGLCGNEDCGQMSAWYVLSAAGFYPFAPGQASYTLGSPLFDTIRFVFDGGKVFEIIATGQAADRPYVASALLNGMPYDSAVIRHATLVQGGRLELTMSAEPVREWGVHDALPQALALPAAVLAAPYADPAPRSFRDSLVVALRCADPLVLRTAAILANPLQDADPGEWARIQWRPLSDGRNESESESESGTATGTKFESTWRDYSEPLVFRSDAAIAFRAYGQRKRADGTTEHLFSPEQVSRFASVQEDIGLELGTDYAPQYSAGGDLALVDRLRGPSDFRTGFWQGYEGVNLEATLDLGSVRPVKRVAAGFLQDENAWIFYPVQVLVEVSLDGQSWQTLGSANAPQPWSASGALRHDFVVAASGNARYVRVRALNRGTCPPEHKGAGGKAWIFADEILVE